MAQEARIVLAAAGSLGDIHPMIALGLALRAQGFRAEIAAAADHRDRILAAGLGFHEVGPSLAQLEADTGMDLAALTGAVAHSSGFLFRKLMLAYAEASARKMIAVTAGATAVVGSIFAPGAAMAAEKWGLPLAWVCVQPSTLFSDHDPPIVPGLPLIGPAKGPPRLWVNRAFKALGRRATRSWPAKLDRIRETLKLAPVSRHPLFDALEGTDLALGLYSPLFGPRPADAPPHFHVVGPATYDSEGGGPPDLPGPVRAFLEQDSPPVVFTLGSAAVHIPGEFYSAGLKAARALGRRAILVVGPDDDLASFNGPDVLAIRYAPFSRLFAAAAVVVHAGGIGAGHLALAAGKPQLMVPHLGDQFDNAARVARLGCGRVLGRGRYTSTVTDSLRRLLNDPELAARARFVAGQTGAEDGARTGAALIVDMIQNHGSVTVKAGQSPRNAPSAKG
jgi:UDP:flavonoid glycosyltransferase YjiC (YdhE family)